MVFFFSSRRRHTRCSRDWSSDVCSSDLVVVRRLVVDFQQSFNRDELALLEQVQVPRINCAGLALLLSQRRISKNSAMPSSSQSGNPLKFNRINACVYS